MVDIQLHLGDCLDVLPTLPDNSVDSIVTDPPYPKQYLPLYQFIAQEGARILKPGGSFLAIVPHYAMPQVLSEAGQHLKYRWTMCMWQGSGKHPRMAMGIEVLWKPIVWWVKGAWPQGRGFVRDGFENGEPSKAEHPWEQSLDWAQFCMKVVPEGGIVVDPLMGLGTIGVACAETGRPFIGIEIDPTYYAIAEKRIAEAQMQPVLL